MSVPVHSEFLLFSAEDGRIRIETRMTDATVWLSQAQMCELFDKNKRTVSEHIRNIFAEGELQEAAVVRKFRTTGPDGKTYDVLHYNLDVVISVGYRVRSLRGTQFRIWATERLREYLVKGFAMDDERLKQGGGGAYFDELLARIRDIRSTEKIFWRKVLDIYALSIDYDPRSDLSREFFKVMQNKMHWAAHGQTASELIFGRADAAAPNMGMTHWVGTQIRKSEAESAKNYLSESELDVLNRIVTMYLEFAELQALNRTPMTMRDWIAKLDDFLKLTGREILTHAGKISHDMAMQKARAEYEKYRAAQLGAPTAVEAHFVEAEAQWKQIEQVAKALPSPKKKKGGRNG